MRGDKATVAVADASHDPHAYEFVRPERMGAILEEEPVAFLPVGCLEYHGPHLPLGVDMLTADAICHRTAVVTGGVVLPPFWLASGVLPLPHGIVVDLDVLRTAIRPILRQLAEGGFEVIVVVSGHGDRTALLVAHAGQARGGGGVHADRCRRDRRQGRAGHLRSRLSGPVTRARRPGVSAPPPRIPRRRSGRRLR